MLVLLLVPLVAILLLLLIFVPISIVFAVNDALMRSGVIISPFVWSIVFSTPIGLCAVGTFMLIFSGKESSGKFFRRLAKGLGARNVVLSSVVVYRLSGELNGRQYDVAYSPSDLLAILQGGYSYHGYFKINFPCPFPTSFSIRSESDLYHRFVGGKPGYTVEIGNTPSNLKYYAKTEDEQAARGYLSDPRHRAILHKMSDKLMCEQIDFQPEAIAVWIRERRRFFFSLDGYFHVVTPELVKNIVAGLARLAGEISSKQ